jgi:hypothetical protein
MKRILSILAVVGIAAMSASCEKCMECTFEDEDLGTLSEEWCEKGHVYDDQLKTYEDRGWVCVEK